MKTVILILFMYFSFGVTSFNEKPFEDKGEFKMTIPNVKDMEKEVSKLTLTIIKANKLNTEVNTTLETLDSLNNSLVTRKDIRQYKKELRRNR